MFGRLIDRVFLKNIHEAYFFGRRLNVLKRSLIDLLPAQGTVLDVGCGDGQLDLMMMKERPGLTITGIDVLTRKKSYIPVTEYDGKTIPFPDGHFDTVLFVDVLHHTHDPKAVLREAARVAKRTVVIKDHLADPLLGWERLRFMDWVGNFRYGVSLPYHYLTEAQWRSTCADLGLEVTSWNTEFGLYPGPLDLVFGKGLHFAARLEKR